MFMKACGFNAPGLPLLDKLIFESNIGLEHYKYNLSELSSINNILLQFMIDTPQSRMNDIYHPCWTKYEPDDRFL